MDNVGLSFRALTMSRIMLVMLLCMFSMLRADNRLEWFASHYVEDFARTIQGKRMTPEKQEKMAKRRRGIYISDLGEHAPRLSAQIGMDVRRFYIDISDEKSPKLIFECADGGRVSNQAFLEGKMSDLSFSWGTPDRGIVAWYGVLGDYLPIAFCPQLRPMTFVMKRWCGQLDLKKIRLIAPIIQFGDDLKFGSDVFSLVCETEAAARACRLRAGNDSPALVDKKAEIVACYVKENAHGRKYYWPHLEKNKQLPLAYLVLESDGEIHLIEGDGKDEFRWRPNFDFHWWDEFGERAKGRYGVFSAFYDVRRDEIIKTSSPFFISQSLDARIHSPALFRSKQGLISRGEVLDEQVSRECKNPQDMFIRIKYVRIKNTEENRTLRKKLKDTIDVGCGDAHE